jgi:hypothetical protein
MADSADSAARGTNCWGVRGTMSGTPSVREMRVESADEERA